MNKIEINKKLKLRGLTIIEDFDNLDRIKVKDNIGYKYIIRYYNIVNTNQGCSPFHKANPYTIENIQTYLNQFEQNSKILSKEFLGNQVYLDFKCNICGKKYQRPWYKMQLCKNKICNKCQKKLSLNQQKYSFDEVKSCFQKKGYQILDKEYINNCTPISCRDNLGYRYKISLQNIEKGRKPRMFSWSHNFQDCEANLKNFIKINKLRQKVVEIYHNRKAKFQCECGNFFVTDVYKFISGEKRRCSKCTKKISGLELSVMEFLKQHKINFKYQYCYKDLKNKRLLPFDFYLVDYNVCVEVDGGQHFYPAFTNDIKKAKKNLKSTQDNDKKKEKYCKDNNIVLIRLPYWQIQNNKYKEILSQFINTN